jgi:hypothetical protein
MALIQKFAIVGRWNTLHSHVPMKPPMTPMMMLPMRPYLLSHATHCGQLEIEFLRCHRAPGHAKAAHAVMRRNDHNNQ